MERRCHWCSGPEQRMRSKDMVQVIEGPMRFYFCSAGCRVHWTDRRFEPDVALWLRECVSDRAKVLNASADATNQGPPKARRALAGLCELSRVALSMPQGP